MNVIDLPNDTFAQFKQLQHDYIGYQSLTDVPRVLNYHDELKDFSVIFVSVILLFHWVF